MAAPSTTLKTLKNQETGIDITVPGILEEEAPLGGISILYEISICTKLDAYKSSLHKDQDVVQFSVFKAYREIEDLYNKFCKKYPEIKLPPIPTSSSIDKLTADERVAIFNKFMVAVSQDKKLSQSSIFNHFTGISQQKGLVSHASNKGEAERVAHEIVQKSDKPSDLSPKTSSSSVKTGVTESPEKVDLFDELKSSSDNQSRTADGLFDDIDDADLFSTKPTSKVTRPPKAVPAPSLKVGTSPTVTLKQKSVPESKSVDTSDSQIIIKDRNLGEVSLFGEQDLGDYITKEEEPLFLVTPKVEKGKKNELLFSSNSLTDEVEDGVPENLDELLSMNPLPILPISSESSSSLSEISPESEEKPVEAAQASEVPHSQPRKPVPLPRKKSLEKADSDNLSMKKPEIMPRKVFLKKPPEVPAKPPISAKPAVLPKPKPPIKGPKPTLTKAAANLDAVNANGSATATRTESSVSGLTEELGQLDILKYIEQEQKLSEAEPSLFD